MDCKKIQEYIITDYIDDQMGDKQKSLIDQHLAHCHVCEEFLISLKNGAVNPFRIGQKFVPDEFLWSRIKRTIEEVQERQEGKGFIPDFWEKLRFVFYIPRPF